MSITNEYYRCVRRNPYLVCYWRMNDTSGTYAIDYSGKYNINGIYNGLPLISVPLINSTGNEINSFSPRSRLFGGSGQNVEVPNASQLNINGNISIEAWIISLHSNQTSIIIGKPHQSSITTLCPYYMGLESGKAFFSNNNGNITSTSVVPISMPNHIVASIFKETLSLFVNGKKVKSLTIGTTNEENSEPLYIGGTNETYLNKPFNGMIAEVAIYKSSLSEKIIEEHYNIGKQIIFRKPYYTTYDPPTYS